MIERVGNLWTVNADWRGITTNGYIKNNGECVMGRGVALQAKQKFPNLPKELGDAIRRGGNTIHSFNRYKLFSFPVKHSWDQKADIELIRKSALQLRAWAEAEEDLIFALPRPGCGNGQLSWEEVKPQLLDLSDNVIVLEYQI